MLRRASCTLKHSEREKKKKRMTYAEYTFSVEEEKKKVEGTDGRTKDVNKYGMRNCHPSHKRSIFLWNSDGRTECVRWREEVCFFFSYRIYTYSFPYFFDAWGILCFDWMASHTKSEHICDSARGRERESSSEAREEAITSTHASTNIIINKSHNLLSSVFVCAQSTRWR